MELADVLSIDVCTYEFEPRPMIYPTETAPVIVRENGRTELRPMRWGLIPHWAEDESLGKKLFNARVETAAKKPSFRDAWKKRRCLIPATGFYEWNHNAATGKRIPTIFISLKTKFSVLLDSGNNGDGHLQNNLNFFLKNWIPYLKLKRHLLFLPPHRIHWLRNTMIGCRSFWAIPVENGWNLNVISPTWLNRIN